MSTKKKTRARPRYKSMIGTAWGRAHDRDADDAAALAVMRLLGDCHHRMGVMRKELGGRKPCGICLSGYFELSESYHATGHALATLAAVYSKSKRKQGTVAHGTFKARVEEHHRRAHKRR